MKKFSLEEYLKNPSRKVVTRKGYPATIVSTTFHQENYPVVAEVCFSSYDKKQSYSFTANGSFLDSSEDPRDLFFAPEEHEGWINLFGGSLCGLYIGDLRIFESKENAEKNGKNNRDYVKSIKIKWEE